ncbi:MAG TPA: NYN domain-containing protein [Polyangiaceae bacterium]
MNAHDLWLIDGFNVLHACILKGRDRHAWWRAEAQTRVAQWLESFARHHPVVIVFDAARPDSERCANSGFSASLRFAADADAAIVEAVSAASGRACVVTADRSLTDRCKARGARTLRPWAFDELMASTAGAAGRSR